MHGAQRDRGLGSVARSSLYQGKFGRMFRHLPPFLPDDQDLIALAELMFEPAADLGLDTSLPAGFTYLGQFVDHDITFDPTSKLQQENDPDALHNFRTPRFDLDSVYAAGPAAAPFLYDRESGGFKFLLGKTDNQEDDLPRNSQGLALIGDPRNDENLIISQLHLLFLKFHNRVYDALAERISDPQSRFDEARRIVRWHYQWIILHDFLVRLTGEVIADILKTQPSHAVASLEGKHTVSVVKAELKFFEWKNQPFMPVEFSAAAYRFGHSLIRFDYDLNSNAQQIPIFGPHPDPAPREGDLKGDLRGFRKRPPGRRIDWELFFPFPNQPLPQPTRKLDTKLTLGLRQLPGFGAAGDHSNPPSLAERNLARGKALGLPSGQAVANAMGLPLAMILTDVELDFGDLASRFAGNAPLWYYILKEAEVKGRGERLGPVGGRIVAEVLIGLLDGDPASYLSMSPNWQPTQGEFGAPANGTYSMADLIRFAQGQ
jgi:hypothetical protein